MSLLQKIILGLFGTVFTIGSSWYLWEVEQPQNTKQTSSKHQIITGKMPDDFFDTFPKSATQEQLEETPIPEPIIEVKEPEPKVIVKWINPNDLFKKPTKPEPPKQSAEEIKRNQILNTSLFEQQFTNEVVNLDQAPEGEPLYDFEDLNKNTDFSEHGIPTIEATYPVDLTRVLTMNKHIPAVLYTEIQSELPSDKVIAVIEQNVTGYHGRKILIPRGSQAIGKFGALKSPDSERLGIIWYRILTPEGINISLTSEAMDQEGASGLTGFIDKRWKDKYGTALLFSSISALAQLSVPVENENVKAAADGFSSELGPIVAEQLRQSLNIVQRINIPKGTRFNISPLVDIWFKQNLNNVSGQPLMPSVFNIGRVKE